MAHAGVEVLPGATLFGLRFLGTLLVAKLFTMNFLVKQKASWWRPLWQSCGWFKDQATNLGIPKFPMTLFDPISGV